VARELGTPLYVYDLMRVEECSPREVLHALDNGWPPKEVSFTGTNVSERDLDVLLADSIHVNVDLLSQLERL